MACILALSCEAPEGSGRPISRWTPREVAEEAVKRGMVERISVRQVGRFLKIRRRWGPHLSRLWQNAAPADPQAFAEQVGAACSVYRQAAVQLHQEGVGGVCSDEMSGIQALERLKPTKPTRPGRIEKRERHYRRHGTQALIGNFEVACGRLVSPTVGGRRTEADFASRIARTLATDLQAGWIFVVDNLDIHQSASLVRLVAAACGLQEDLGGEGNAGRSQIQIQPAGVLERSGPPDSVPRTYTGRPLQAGVDG